MTNKASSGPAVSCCCLLLLVPHLDTCGLNRCTPHRLTQFVLHSSCTQSCGCSASSSTPLCTASLSAVQQSWSSQSIDRQTWFWH
jgi:hypothetical protein